jgi:ubiquitin-like protein Nedd8
VQLVAEPVPEKFHTDSHLDSLRQIFIKTLTGRKQALNFEPDNQVLAVKQALQEKEGIQVDQIKLIHSGKQLADDKTLEYYNIQAGATIHMVLQLRGGAGAWM